MDDDRSAPPPPTLVVRENPRNLASSAASWLAAVLREAIGRRGTAVVAFSGGSTPRPLFEALTTQDLAWERIHVLQVDERIAPDGDIDRNLTGLRSALLERVPLPSTNLHPMPVADLLADAASSPTLHRKATDAYSATIARLCGGVIDVVHLGLGDDGHTASLVPGDPVLAVTDHDAAVTEVYNGRRRMTLTYPVLDRAGAVLWLVAGSAKASVLPRLVAHDPTIPAGRVHNPNAVVFADAAAAARLPG